jgi:O-antigen ligase
VSLRRAAAVLLSVTAAALPLYVVRWRVGPLPTTLLEVLIAATAAVYVASLVGERRLPIRTGYEIPIAMLLIAGAIGVAVAPDHTRAAGIYRAYFVEPIVLFYVAVDVLEAEANLRLFLPVAAAGACAMAIGQIVSFTWVAAHGHLKLGDAPAFLNTSPNADALYFEIPIAFALAFTLYPARPRERWIAAGVLALLAVADLLTLSRGSYVALAVLAVVIALNLQTARWRLRAVGAIAVLALVAIEIPFVNQRFLSLARSVTNRTSLYHQALEMLSQRPVFGAGISGFPVRVAPFRPPKQPIQLYPHDFWLTTWSEIGLLGVLAFALIVFGLLWQAARAVRHAAGVHRAVLWGAIGGLVLFLVHGLVDSPYWKNDLSGELWLLAGLEVMALRGVRASRSETPNGVAR